MLDAVFGPIDGALAFLPPLVRLLAWGLVTGAGTMFLYGKLSPQERIAAAQAGAAEARQAMQAYDGHDFRIMGALIRRALGAAFKQVGLVLGPTLLAAFPLLALLTWLARAYSEQVLLAFGPAWMRSWEPPFLLALTVSALTVKFALRIK